MILILQSLSADIATLHRIGALAEPQQTFEFAPHALRCVGLSFTEHVSVIQEKIATLAFQEQVDVHWINSNHQLADFKLLAMDMDSTLITIECIDEIADMQGLKPQVAAITEAAMRGEIAFAESLTQRVALLKGLPATALQQVYDERLQLSPGAEKMLQAVQAAGLKTLLVSGGFTFFTDRVKSKLNLDYSHSNQLEILDGKLTGRVIGGIVDAEEKRRTVERICAELRILPSQAIVMGDGANDLAMMEIAGLSVAFRAKPVVRAKADIALNFVGLDGILNFL
ncbi:phosphoserine phosphatase SerB [Solimicrobium silvestre]|uniref:Phosphoserine phosphatase n=1 Tax=Solimicrobium silvestre TaxID=2099400 RepID=A0A2S9GXZ4_9BURK|nr:phosphoserine phosphatase SerB [Solimicrobium silvestre]PRC92597.1 serB: phosphoserine phosphatase SerB [Solimicrobium silvestre]